MMNFNFDLYLLNEKVQKFWNLFEKRLSSKLTRNQQARFNEISVYTEAKDGDYTDEEVITELWQLKMLIEKIFEEFNLDRKNLYEHPYDLEYSKEEIEEKIIEAIEQDQLEFFLSYRMDDELFDFLFASEIEEWDDGEYQFRELELDDFIEDIDYAIELIEFDRIGGDLKFLELIFKIKREYVTVEYLRSVEKYLVFTEDTEKPLAIIEKEKLVGAIPELLSKENAARRKAESRKKIKEEKQFESDVAAITEAVMNYLATVPRVIYEEHTYSLWIYNPRTNPSPKLMDRGWYWDGSQPAPIQISVPSEIAEDWEGSYEDLFPHDYSEIEEQVENSVREALGSAN